MRISERFSLNKLQPELDFVDVDLERDTPLFIDPYFLSLRVDALSTNASRTVRNFFQRIISLIGDSRNDEAIELLNYLKEPNETCLGLSVGRPRGRGIGSFQAEAIFRSLQTSRAVQTGLVEDIEDCQIFVDNIGKDKVSDMTTNVIRKHLITYTQKQCEIWDIPMHDGTPSGFYWNRSTETWSTEYTNMLVADERIILLVPKSIVSFCNNYVPSKYYQHYILNFMQNEHLRLGSHLVRSKQNRNGEIVYNVYKKDVAEEHPYSKEYLTEFTALHPEIFSNFRQETSAMQTSLLDEEIIGSNIDIESLCENLIETLNSIPPGRDNASRYHKLVFSILELLMYPHLTSPQIEREINEGRKRIDISFDNAATSGFFYDLHNVNQIPCTYIFVECKNYTNDPSNPELDQLIGRFSPNRGKFGMLCCRTIDNINLFKQRCRDSYISDHGLIIPITDDDLIESLESVASGDATKIFEILTNRKRDILLG